MIIPGILETDFEEVKHKVELVQNVSSIIQIDINDSTLFEGQTFLDISLLEGLVTPSSFELHLMVKHPIEYVSRKFKNVSRVLPHVEAEGLSEFISRMKNLEYSIGLAIDANTDVEMLNPYLDKIDYVQFMTINTGKSGQAFRNDILDVITRFIQNNPSLSLPIQTDGGGNKKTIPVLQKIGVRDFAVTSAIFNTDNPAQAKLDLEKLLV